VYRRTFLNLGAAAAAAGVAGLAGIDLQDGAEVTEADLEQLDRIVVRLRALARPWLRSCAPRRVARRAP
jgi:hypothetical protein